MRREFEMTKKKLTYDAKKHWNLGRRAIPVEQVYVLLESQNHDTAKRERRRAARIVRAGTPCSCCVSMRRLGVLHPFCESFGCSTLEEKAEKILGRRAGR